MREQMREVFDQYNGSAQFPLFFRGCDLIPVLVGDMQNILRTRADGLHDHARDVGMR